MKKIDVITIHRNCNYGSVLQTLATQTIFENLGYECEIIDYIRDVDTKKGLLRRLKYKSRKLEKNIFLLTIARIVMYISYLKKEYVFSSFLKKYINLTPISYYSNDSLRDLKADAFCTGSDQIWNSYWNEGIEEAYYLKFAGDNSTCFSYSSSIGNEYIAKDEAEQIIPFLSKYKYLSVREKNSVKILSELGFNNVQQVLDPTLYLDTAFWDKVASDKYKNMKYVLTYNLHHDKKLDEYAQKLAKDKGLQLINISYNWHDIIRKGKLAWCPKVEEYLGLIKYADYVIADSFHATVFSIQFMKNFIVFYPEKASIRMRDLLQLTGLVDRGVDSDDVIPALEKAYEKIDWDNAYYKLNEMRLLDHDFLSKISKVI